ncbi:ShlB/FhaC/HecB family hemolysin secretion/activation protein [Limnohabitans lacus]|uniref:ShlB/FhaC/HecB family hemolysin secretion/activation protein n=1 Tax=Limnohabitans lacus TaxID=3045173 RepID=A0ABT6X4T6_9BURK|nr:ShlB/FhaC/HecB family hemolysin secretion/activation protein [Limnohabitans sp. HM2-2]MDI9232982.1 ShlB/FhaC/HecB family hemolysin secretion/activation protein [Limnohabitans sp. HM2-2]
MQKVLRWPQTARQSRSQAGTSAWIKTLVGTGALLWLVPMASQAQSVPAVPNANIFIEQERRDAERAAQQRAQQERSTDVKLPSAPTAAVGLLPTDETPCFKIQVVTLDAGLDLEPKDLLDAIGKTSSGVMDSPLGRCIGAKGVQIVIDRLQNELITRGYVTSRILAKPQNLQNGTLALELMFGKINRVQWAPPASGQMHRATEWNILPMQQGDLLNLRDIEQALENYKRVPTVEADIQIVPANEPGYSDLRIQHSQAFPFRLSMSADDSGTRSTGKYQGSTTVSYDNWWTLSDLFYVTLNQDLGGKDPGARGNKGHTVHYSVPWGYNLLSFNTTSSQYHQTVAGVNQDYVYAGSSETTDVKLSRIIDRNAVGKTTLSFKGFQRKSRNYVDDTEVEVQRRSVSGWEMQLAHKHAIGPAAVEGSLSYKRGTGAYGSLPAPEEQFGEGTSRMQIVLADAHVQWPFKLADQPVTYSGQFRGQYNGTPLTPQDRFVIGGRYTVRGFDGLNVLSAERGWLIRNEWNTPVSSGHKVYAALDHGHVDGASADLLVGQSLTGSAVGLRGQIGPFQYDVFVGKPLSKPQHFNTSKTTAGFSLYANF